MEPKFDVEFLKAAIDFIDNLDEKPREKVLYNLHKSRFIIDKKLFKKLSGNT